MVAEAFTDYSLSEVCCYQLTGVLVCAILLIEGKNYLSASAESIKAAYSI